MPQTIQAVVSNAPFFIIVAYCFLLMLLFVSSTFRSRFADAHREKSLNSWIRYMGTFVILSAIVIAIAQVAGNKEVNFPLVTTMLGIAFGGKVAQKHIENKDLPTGDLTEEQNLHVDQQEISSDDTIK